MTKKFLILGVNGQDGKLLSKCLLNSNIDVVGLVRSNKRFDPSFEYLDIGGKLRQIIVDEYSTSKLIEIIKNEKPDYLVNFIAQSSVGQSFLNPIDTFHSSVNINLFCLEALRLLNSDIQYFYASSGECLRLDKDDTTQLIPNNYRSPYAYSKLVASEHVKFYRQEYGVQASSGFFFNHESEFRNMQFVVPKIINSALDIRQGTQENIILGNVNIIRDWGLAEEYMSTLSKFLQENDPIDVEFATGIGMSIHEVVEIIFSKYGLSLSKHLVTDNSFARPGERQIMIGDRTTLQEHIGWEPRFTGEGLILELAERFERYRTWLDQS